MEGGMDDVRIERPFAGLAGRYDGGLPLWSHVECEGRGVCEIGTVSAGDRVLAPDGMGFKWAEVTDAVCEEPKTVFEYRFHNGMSFQSSADFRCFCGDGMRHPMSEVVTDDLMVVGRGGLMMRVSSFRSIGAEPVVRLSLGTLDHLFFADGVMASGSAGQD